MNVLIKIVFIELPVGLGFVNVILNTGKTILWKSDRTVKIVSVLKVHSETIFDNWQSF